jgi:GrpB-like predicted nucleotidyltransferase (UPF0157 family)
MIDLLRTYDPEWAEEFERLKALYVQALQGISVDVQHVGSTSIPGAVAKPILDIDIILPDTSLLLEVSLRLEQLGYRGEGEKGIPGRYAFRQKNAYTPHTSAKREWMEHHLYVCFPDALALKNHLLFRDHMRARPLLVEAYSKMKLELAARPGITRETYWREKTSFILNVLAEAGLDASELASIAAVN